MLIFFLVIFVLLPLCVTIAKSETERQRRETMRLVELTIARRGPDSAEWQQFISEATR